MLCTTPREGEKEKKTPFEVKKTPRGMFFSTETPLYLRAGFEPPYFQKGFHCACCLLLLLNSIPHPGP